MPNGRRWSVALSRKFVAVGLTAMGFFTAFFGLGMSNWPVAALGVAFIVIAISLVIVSAVRGGARSFVRGTAHVRDVTEPPSSTPVGRCEMEVVIEAPGVAPSKIKIRDTRVPVAKWPDVGDTLPVRVAIEDPRHVRVLWDEVRTHGEEAAEEERFNEYVQRIVNAGLGDDSLEHDTLDDIPPFEASPPPPSPPPRPRANPAPSLVDLAAPAAPATTATRRRPSPRPRRPAHAAPSPPVTVPPTAAMPAAVALAEPPAEAFDDEVPVHDIVPIEGASAVFQEPSPEPAVGGIRGVGVTLIVTNLTRSIDFYRELLGFQVIDSSTSSAVLAAGDTRIMLRCVSDMPPVDRRLVHLNLEVADVEAMYEQLRAKGVKFTYQPRRVARGERMELWAAAFRDPDGHGIAITRWQSTLG